MLAGFTTENGPEDYEEFGLAALPSAEKQFDRLVFVVIDALRRYSVLNVRLMK